MDWSPETLVLQERHGRMNPADLQREAQQGAAGSRRCGPNSWAPLQPRVMPMGTWYIWVLPNGSSIGSWDLRVDWVPSIDLAYLGFQFWDPSKKDMKRTVVNPSQQFALRFIYGMWTARNTGYWPTAIFSMCIFSTQSSQNRCLQLNHGIGTSRRIVLTSHFLLNEERHGHGLTMLLQYNW